MTQRCALFLSLLTKSRFHRTPVPAQLVQSQSAVDVVIGQTREKSAEHLHTAQELSLLRHSLADELSFLSGELVSSLSEPEEGPTLLEDLEALHRGLKELESVKGYVQVIEHALKLRCASVLVLVGARLEEHHIAKPRSRKLARQTRSP